MEDTSHIKSENGVIVVPTEEYIIDISEKRILPKEEWQKRFDYNPKKYSIEGTNFQLLTQRVSSNGTDLIEESLINLSDGSVNISKSSGVAFREEKRKNLYEYYLERKESDRRREDKLKNELTLEYFYHQQKLEFKFGQVILKYKNAQNICYRAIVWNDDEINVETGGEIPKDFDDRRRIHWSAIKKFDSVEDFWRVFSSNKNWYREFEPFWQSHPDSLGNSILAFYVIHQANQNQIYF